MKAFILVAVLTVSSFSFSQTTYNDVAVIVNTNSQNSIDIANYFQQARNIPAQNMIYVSAPTTEDIDSATFEALRGQIEDYLTQNNLVDSFNYLVTTKGVPLTVETGCFNSGNQGSGQCATVDNELTMILGPYAGSIGQNGSAMNPIHNTTAHFSRSATGLYLVTRLDAYTVNDVYNLIDRSGPSTGVNKASSQAIIDLNAASGADSVYFYENVILPPYDTLTANGWTAQIDANTNPLLNQNIVSAYVYGGGGPLLNVDLNYTWTEGSIASMSTCGTAYTFDQAQNTLNYLTVSDLIADGCTGAYGHVECLYFSQVLRSDILMNRYFNETESYNLAESFYMAERFLSWQTVIVGDPKTSIFVDNLAETGTQEEVAFSIYPNPSSGTFNIRAGGNIESLVVYDMKGTVIKMLDHLSGSQTALDLNGYSEGVYIVQTIVDGSPIKERVVVQN